MSQFTNSQNNKYDFAVGQRVECVDNNGTPELTIEAEYTVSAVRKLTGGIQLEEVEIREPSYSGYFKKERFINSQSN